MNVANAGRSVDCGSPCPDNPKNRRACVKFVTPATASTASFQSVKESEVENACGSGCLYSQIVETKYGIFSSKMFAASSVRPPHVELYRAFIGWSWYVATTPRVSWTACVESGFSPPCPEYTWQASVAQIS